MASDFASSTGSCSCGTTTVVTSRTRVVQAATAPSRVRVSGLSKAIRSPKHSEANGPSSTARDQASSVAGPSAHRSGSITGSVIPTRMPSLWQRAANVGAVRQPRGGCAGGAVVTARPSIRTWAPEVVTIRSTPLTGSAKRAIRMTTLARGEAEVSLRTPSCWSPRKIRTRP